MRRRLVGICVILLAGVVLSGAANREDFLVKTGEDLVELCEVDDNDPLLTAALHFCHGFAVGTYRTLVAATREDPVVCEPEDPVSRNEAILMFVEWARANPAYLSEAPEELVVRFVLQQWPCPQ
ncbi:MAG: Rap1a/Tai family immunity protein [Candidatus Methylomirabilales bacterium]